MIRKLIKPYPRGDRISITKFPLDYVLEKCQKERGELVSITIGFAYRGEMLLNPMFLKVATLKQICALISHEFLHLLLDYEHSKTASIKLDNIARTLDDAYTECGGL